MQQPHGSSRSQDWKQKMNAATRRAASSRPRRLGNHGEDKTGWFPRDHGCKTRNRGLDSGGNGNKSQLHHPRTESKLISNLCHHSTTRGDTEKSCVLWQCRTDLLAKENIPGRRFPMRAYRDRSCAVRTRILWGSTTGSIGPAHDERPVCPTSRHSVSN